MFSIAIECPTDLQGRVATSRKHERNAEGPGAWGEAKGGPPHQAGRRERGEDTGAAGEGCRHRQRRRKRRQIPAAGRSEYGAGAREHQVLVRVGCFWKQCAAINKPCCFAVYAQQFHLHPCCIASLALYPNAACAPSLPTRSTCCAHTSTSAGCWMPRYRWRRQQGHGPQHPAGQVQLQAAWAFLRRSWQLRWQCWVLAMPALRAWPAACVKRLRARRSWMRPQPQQHHRLPPAVS